MLKATLKEAQNSLNRDSKKDESNNVNEYLKNIYKVTNDIKTLEQE